MDHKTKKFLTSMKKPNHNVYSLSPLLYSIVSVCGLALWVTLLADVYLRSQPLLMRLLPGAAVLAAATAASIIAGSHKKVKVTPYTRWDGFSFIGLHDLKEGGLNNKNDILSRDEEIEYINNILEKTVFPQDSVKQALCLAGPSGCGKSTILAFFRQQYKDHYHIYDFSGNYRKLKAHMAELFGNNIDVKIDKLTYSGKVVFILDQFERYFFLSEKEQSEIRDIINSICQKNTAVIVSLREEYLADFLKQFDMNNLKSSDKTASPVQRGILKTMVSVIEKEMNIWTASRQAADANTIVWGTHRIKNNARHYLDTADNAAERTILEQMGATLLYCQNQNEMQTQIGGNISKTSLLESKCRMILDENGEKLFEKHADEPLIEQQIIFHMAEFNKKINNYSSDDLEAFISMDNNELLSQYYDIQLASCPSFFHSSRLLYLLSQARLYQLSISTNDIKNCLFPDLMDRDGQAQLNENIRQLEKLQLIRESMEKSDNEYEIAHDFIAKTFLDYCATNMHRGVKTGLDIFISEYQNERRRVAFAAKIEHRKKAYKDHFAAVTSIITAAVMVLTYLLERFVYNPWSTVLKNWNPYGSYVPAFPLFITGLSLIYIYFIYDKVAKYYRGNKLPYVKTAWVFFLFMAALAVFAYPHFLTVIGLDLAVAALSIGFLLEPGYRESCRHELLMYGVKSFTIGFIFSLIHVFFLLVNRQFDNFLIVSEFFMFTILIAYAMIAHITKEYLFARMLDASSEKL